MMPLPALIEHARREARRLRDEADTAERLPAAKRERAQLWERLADAAEAAIAGTAEDTPYSQLPRTMPPEGER